MFDDSCDNFCVLDEKFLEYRGHQAHAVYLFNRDADIGTWIVIIPGTEITFTADSIEHAEADFRVFVDFLEREI